MDRKYNFNRFFMLLMLTCTGCTAPEYLEGLASSLIPAQKKETAPLVFYEWSQTATSEQLTFEMERLQALTEQQSDPVTLIQQAIVRLAVDPGSSPAVFEDLNALQQDCVSQTCVDYVRLATALGKLVDERQRLKAARTERIRGQEDLTVLRTEVTTLQQRIAKLEAQIEALTNLEQEIIQRELYQLPQ